MMVPKKIRLQMCASHRGSRRWGQSNTVMKVPLSAERPFPFQLSDFRMWELKLSGGAPGHRYQPPEQNGRMQAVHLRLTPWTCSHLLQHCHFHPHSWALGSGSPG